MTILERFLAQLKIRSLEVRPGSEPGTLTLCGPNHEKTPDIIAAVKSFKPELLKMFSPAIVTTQPPPKSDEGKPGRKGDAEFRPGRDEKPPEPDYTPDWADADRPRAVELASGTYTREYADGTRVSEPLPSQREHRDP